MGLVFAAAAFGLGGGLNFIGCVKDKDTAGGCSDGGGTVDGLSGVGYIATSPDGKHVYTTSGFDDTLTAFSRDPASGALAFIEFEKDNVAGVDGLDSPTGVSVSADGKNVYVTGSGDDSVATFNRDAVSGALTFVEVDKNGDVGVSGLNAAIDLTVSPDGKNVYVVAGVDDAVVTFNRDPATGALTFVELDDDGIDYLDGARGVAISPDGKHVYVASGQDQALSTFSRDATTGALTFVETDRNGLDGVTGLDFPTDVTISPDGKHVYTSSSDMGGAVAAFSRDATTGSVTFVEAKKDGIGAVDGLAGASDVTTSPDGQRVYVAGAIDNAVAAFSRDATTGSLTFIEFKQDGFDGVDGLEGASGVAAAPDGKHVYVAAFDDDAVSLFATAADTTAPETTITSGPSGSTTETSPSFGFVSSEVGSSFQCRTDGGPFSACSSPTAIGPLGPGAHSFEVRATDAPGNTDPSAAIRSFVVVAGSNPTTPTPNADTEVTDADLSVAKTLTLNKQVKIKLKAGAQEPVDLIAKGEVTVKSKGGKGKGRRGKGGGKTFALKTVMKSTGAGEQTVLRLKPKKKNDAKKILMLLKQGQDLRANPSVEFTDQAGNSVTEKRVVRLKVKKGGGKKR